LGTSDITFKTVNGNALQGTGDIAVQPTLVSGTNIKTVNGVTLLGTGDIATAGTVTNTFTGSQTAPSFIPNGSTIPVNGMYLPSTNTVAWATNSALKLSLGPTGDLTAIGNVTAYSDERLKKNWRSVSTTLLTDLANVQLCGIYDRVDQEVTQVGMSAQELQRILPEGVGSDENGILSIAYGNVALTVCVLLAREVRELKRQIEELKA